MSSEELLMKSFFRLFKQVQQKVTKPKILWFDKVIDHFIQGNFWEGF